MPRLPIPHHTSSAEQKADEEWSFCTGDEANDCQQEGQATSMDVIMRGYDGMDIDKGYGRQASMMGKRNMEGQSGVQVSIWQLATWELGCIGVLLWA